MSADGKRNKSSYFDLWSDGVCVYLTIKVRNPLVPKIALLLADLIVLSAVVTGFVVQLPGLIIMALLLLALLTRYTLWNFFGEEHLIINTASFSYQHHYGFIRTSYTTKNYSKGLTIYSRNEQQEELKSQSQICFRSYDAANNLPVELYSTSFYIDQEDFDRLLRLINDIFVQDAADRYDLPQINLN